MTVNTDNDLSVAAVLEIAAVFGLLAGVILFFVTKI